MSLLLKYGGDENIASKDGSVLHATIKADNEVVAAFLIERPGQHLDYFIEDANKDNVLFACARQSANNVLNMILTRAIAESREQEGRSPVIELLNKRHPRTGDHIIHLLARQKNMPMLNFIRKNKEALRVDFEARDREGQTVADIEVGFERAREMEAARAKERQEAQQIKRRQQKVERAVEDKQQVELQAALERREQEKQLEMIEAAEKNLQRRKFLCIVFILAFVVLLYFFVKFKVETKRKYIF